MGENTSKISRKSLHYKGVISCSQVVTVRLNEIQGKSFDTYAMDYAFTEGKIY